MHIFEPISPTKRSSTSTTVAESIRNAIATGQLCAGDKLPPERDIARMMGVSRSAIRDALQTLGGMGLINVRHGSGVYVADSDDLNTTTRQVAASLLLQKKPLWDLFEIRELLETEAAAWAARRASPGEVEQLRQVFAEYAANSDDDNFDAEAANQYDRKLHRLIAVAARNEVLLHIMDNLEVLMCDSRKISIALPNRLPDTMFEMERIVDAIVNGDIKAARQEMKAHLKNGRKAFAMAGKR